MVNVVRIGALVSPQVAGRGRPLEVVPGVGLPLAYGHRNKPLGRQRRRALGILRTRTPRGLGLALKGRNMTAQGIALGTRVDSFRRKPQRGETKSCYSRLFRPFRATWGSCV